MFGIAESIPRTKLSTINLSDARIKMGKDAQERLGYIPRVNALMLKLKELGIDPLVTSKVEKYMRSKERIGWYSGTKLFIGVMLGLISCIGVFAACMADAGPSVPWSRLHYSVTTMTLCLGLVFIVLSFWAGFEHLGEGYRIEREWRSVGLASYRGIVPEFALSKALQIKEALPAATFDVTFLRETRSEFHKPLPDPFLSVTYNETTLYLDVWDEREFEKLL